MSGFAASKEQRQKCRFSTCAACGAPGPDPAHLIPRSLCTIGQEDARAVVPLCRQCHRAFDEGEFSLLEHLEPLYRTELAYAVARVGLMATVRRVTNQREPVTP